MRTVHLPGARRVDIGQAPDPVPGHGQVVLAVGASTLCGSDLRAIYREHLGEGPEAYQGVVAGHEPSGTVVEVGPGVQRLAVGDRVVIYHISGCGLCDECRTGYRVACTSASRAAYGWQRDGGHADLLLAEEVDCLPLPEPLSLVDGACVACGFGTAYEALLRAQVSRRDDVVVTGLGPVGQAVGLLARALGARTVVGADVVGARRERALALGAVTDVVDSGAHAPLEAVREALGGRGASVTVDASGAAPARALVLAATARWGRCVLVGEGGQLTLEASPALTHPSICLMGSWVTSIGHRAELLERLVVWDVRPEVVVTDRFDIADAGEAYRVADAGTSGKVAIVPRRR